MGEEGGGEDKDEVDLDQQVAHSHFKVTFIYRAFIVVMVTTKATTAATAAK